ncbi:MAG TPA: hypothetical protein VGC85_04665 [Chthoniobacterales bacterium]
MKRCTKKLEKSGSSLVVVIATMTILIVTVAIAAEYTMNIGRLVQRSANLQTALAAADGTLEKQFANWRAICRATPNSPLATSAFSGVPLPTAADLSLPDSAQFAKAGTQANLSDEYDPNYVVSNVKIVAVDGTLQPMGNSATPPKPAVGMSQTGNINTTSASYNYIASADVTLPSVNGSITARVRRVFSKSQLSPWNYAIFYVDPLEIHPGPPFTITGWVHTNSDLYTGHNTLTFADKVTYASDWFINFMPGERQHAGETPARPGTPANLPPARDIALQPFGMDSTAIFTSTDGNPNNDSYHELIEVPIANQSDPLTGSRYWDQAGVVIKVDASNNVTIGYGNPDGTVHAFANTDPLYTMFASAITPNQSITDNREGGKVRLVTLDISKIENNTGGLSPSYKSNFNGIVYIYDASNTTGARKAVRLINGSKIPSTGLTVVSSNPIYIQGNYNTGGNPASNGNPGDPTTPQVSGYTRAPCAVIADAVNILSNSWVDGNSGTGHVAGSASNTTVNTAIVSGIVPSAAPNGDGSYSGGAENFPRLLEDWSAATLTYYGSMVELFRSQQSNGEWGKQNVYFAPTRRWYFDTSFKVRPPPGSLMLYSYAKGRWYVQ